MKITLATKRIQQSIKMHALHMAKQFQGQCRRRSKLGHGYIPNNNPGDDIDGFEKKIIFIFHRRIYFVAFLMSLSIDYIIQFFDEREPTLL